jgi:hypothetical protein
MTTLSLIFGGFAAFIVSLAGAWLHGKFTGQRRERDAQQEATLKSNQEVARKLAVIDRAQEKARAEMAKGLAAGKRNQLDNEG